MLLTLKKLEKHDCYIFEIAGPVHQSGGCGYITTSGRWALDICDNSAQFICERYGTFFYVLCNDLGILQTLTHQNCFRNAKRNSKVPFQNDVIK